MKSSLLTLGLLLLISPCQAQNVVASIKPLHSLVQNILGDTADAELLIDNASPHGYQLKPSDIKTVNRADIFFYFADNLEDSVDKLKDASDQQHKFVKLIDNLEIDYLELGDHDHHHHGDHEEAEAKHDDHGAEEVENEHDHEDEHAEKEHDEHEAVDPHLWLNPQHAVVIAEFITESLISLNPSQADQYRANLENTRQALINLDDQLRAQLAEVKDSAYLVQHEAYQYFERHYELNNKGAIQIDPTVAPSAKHLTEIAEKVRQNNVRCIFSEPQFSGRTVNNLADELNISSGILDPLGADLSPGKQAYFELMTNLANNLAKCLTQAS